MSTSSSRISSSSKVINKNAAQSQAVQSYLRGAIQIAQKKLAALEKEIGELEQAS